MKSCCEKVEVCREWIKNAALLFGNIESLLDDIEKTGDYDQMTLDILRDKLENIEFDLDTKLPDNMVCEHGRK